MQHPETLDPVLKFLSAVGINCTAGEVPEDSFLPGVRIEAGQLIYDPDPLTSPGDLLHEAGHIAIVPARFRSQLSGNIDACLSALDPAGSINHTDLVPIAWSYTAALHAGIDPRLVFDAAGYGADKGNDIALILSQLQMGLFPGISMLAQIGLCSAPPPFGDGTDPQPYPIMKRWLVD